MNNPNDLQNQANELAEQSYATSKKLIASEDPSSSKASNINIDQAMLGRRSFLRGSIAAVLLMTGITSPSKTSADEYNPVRDKMTPVLQHRLGGRETTPEKMPMKEILIMDDAMQVLFKTFNHFSFWSSLVLSGKADETRKTVETVMDYKNRENFWYQKSDDGTITIQRRNEKSPTAYIKIKDGVIKRINDVEINYIKSPILDFDQEWRRVEYLMQTISKKMLMQKRMETGKPPIIADWENNWYSKYSMTLPRIILRSLELKGELTQEEKRVQTELTAHIGNHPLNVDEMQKSIALFRKTGDLSHVKSPTIIVLRRNPNSGDEDSGTPSGIYEIATFGTSLETSMPIAHISRDGFVMEKRNGKFEKSDNRSRPFAQMAIKNLEIGKKLRKNCDDELDKTRDFLVETCTNNQDSIQCFTDSYEIATNSCISEKIEKSIK